jgi:hypothetical protein
MSGGRASQIQALSRALIAITPQCAPVSLPWATKLYDEYNVRIGEPAGAENAAAQDPTGKLSRDGIEFLRKHDPKMLERIEAAQTDDERAAMLAELRPKIPAELVTAADQLEALEDDATQ